MTDPPPPIFLAGPRVSVFSWEQKTSKQGTYFSLQSNLSFLLPYPIVSWFYFILHSKNYMVMRAVSI